MQRRGKTAAGTQRWFCPRCRISITKKRADIKNNALHRQFKSWLGSNDNLEAVARRQDCSSRTLKRRFKNLWSEVPNITVSSNISEGIIISDATYLCGRENVVLVAKSKQAVISWMFSEHENALSWANFFSKLPVPNVIVCDGQRGMLSAISVVWPKVKIQRCLLHVVRLVRIKLTGQPKTEAGMRLKRIASDIFSIRTRRQKRRWLRKFRHWMKKYATFMAERTYGENKKNKRNWWYTHKNLRAARSLFKNALPHLFTFIGHPEIPRTTNHVEGGINARLKELLHRHRGLALPKKQILVSHFLDSKTLQKPPRFVT